MEIIGKIIAVLEERSGIAKGSGKPFRVAQYVLETAEQYPTRVLFEVFGDERINQMNIQAGEVVCVSFDINAREYNGRWYNQLHAWSVHRVSGTQIPQPAIPPMGVDAFPPASATDDLPFDMDVPPF